MSVFPCEILEVGQFNTTPIFIDLLRTPMRLTSYYEIEFYLDNNGITYVDDVEYHLKKSSILICKPGSRRYSTKPFKCLFLYLNIEDEELKKQFDTLPTFIQTLHPANYVEIFYHLEKHFHKSSNFSDFFLQSKLYELFFYLLRDGDKATFNHSALTPTNIQLVIKGKNFIQKHYAEDINLKDIASHVFLSPSYFHKIFSLAMNKSPHEYLVERRISAAKKLLRTTDMTMLEISEKCGFSPQSYFNQIFKNQVGITPTQYQQPSGIHYLTAWLNNKDQS